MAVDVKERQLGGKMRSQLVKKLLEKRISTLQLSRRRIVAQNRQNISCMDLDVSQQRYILCGSYNGTVSIVDLDPTSSNRDSVCQMVRIVRRTPPFGHTVVSCQWYPHDTGVFSTASTANVLQIWDTDRMRPVETIACSNTPIHHHWSTALTGGYPLLALAGGSSNVLLFDLRTGSSVQQLKWHTRTVNLVRWSPIDANILLSAGDDGRVLVWDVRSSKNKLTSLSKNGQTIGPINGLKFSKEGLYLTTIGAGQKLRDLVRNASHYACANKHAEKKCAYSVNISNTDHTMKSIDFDTTTEGTSELTVFLPTNDDILIIRPLIPKMPRYILHGHYSHVNACLFRDDHQQLYSCAKDRMLLAWCSEMDEMDDDHQLFTVERNAKRSLRMDDWSDDD